MEVTINRKNTSYKELSDLIDQVGGYPIPAKDFDGTKLIINYKEPDGVPCCTVMEPGDERGIIQMHYYEDGRTEEIIIPSDY